MKRFSIAALAVLVLCAAPVLAQCQHSSDKAKTCTAKQDKKCCSQSKDGKCCSAQKGKTGCSAEQVAASDKAKKAMCDSAVTCDGDTVRVEDVKLPRIGFKVGDQVTCCMKSAKEMAKGNEAKIKFVVAEKTYNNLGEAKAARVKVLEEYYEDMLKVKYAVDKKCVGCPNAAKAMAKECGKPVQYRLASYNFECKDKAEKVAKDARAASTKVAMNWAVGDKKFCCPSEAKAAAKSNGGKIEYCVGEAKTPCETTAKTRLLEARIVAALEVVAKAAQS